LIKKMKKEIVCGRENINEFRGALKERFPDFFLLVKELYKAGLIEGLRGAKITTIGHSSKELENGPQIAKKEHNE